MRAFCAIVLILGCSSSQKRDVFSAPQSTERFYDHWETILDRRFAFTAERCATGPFEVVIPKREYEFGRRIKLEIYGPRDVFLESQVITDDGARGGIPMPRLEHDQSRCRLEGEDHAVASDVGLPKKPTTTKPGEPEKPPLPPINPARPTTNERRSDPPSSDLRLVVITGNDQEHHTDLKAKGALEFFPDGNPFKSVELTTSSYEGPPARGKTLGDLRIRFWFAKPSDLGGMVFRFSDENLVSDQPLEEYRQRFAVRVKQAANYREYRHEIESKDKSLEAYWKRERADCVTTPQTAFCRQLLAKPSRMPPPPRAEVRPPRPGPNVDWIPGYWAWNADLGDHSWVSGTYVVHVPKPKVAPSPPQITSTIHPRVPVRPQRVEPSRAETTPVRQQTDSETPDALPVIEPETGSEAVRAIDARVEPLPPPRVESLTSPPIVDGAIWIAGHWVLIGTSWRWTAARWVVPPHAGALFRVPSVDLRNHMRVYVPGAWVRFR